MKKLLKQIEALKRSSVRKKVDVRMKEFAQIRGKGKSSEERIFSELCFCLLTANFTAERGMKIQDALGKCVLSDKEPVLARKLKKLGHRFPNARAGYIAGARKCNAELQALLSSSKKGNSSMKSSMKKRNSALNSADRGSSGKGLREWIVANVKGLGWKEASHFLRNIGYTDVAIIDFHILDLLVREGLVPAPKNKALSKAKYLEVEQVLERVSSRAGVNLAELDLYLWYIETGKVLK